MNKEEKELIRVIRAARDIQKFLWGKQNEEWGLEEWRRMFRKRVARIDAIDASNPYAIIELRKRVLQLGALAVGLLTVLNDEMLPEHKKDEPVSNLPEYAKVRQES